MNCWGNAETFALWKILSFYLIIDPITYFQCFTRYPDEQSSDKVTLNKGSLYYMEANMLQSSGDDHLEVGVKLPNGTKIMPITKDMLRVGKNCCIGKLIIMMDNFLYLSIFLKNLPFIHLFHFHSPN